jgi:hypothetical protein
MSLSLQQNLIIGDPNSNGYMDLKLGDLSGKLYFDIKCPNEHPNGVKHRVKRNGHDTSVKGCPQQYQCLTCFSAFYPHTSQFFHKLWNDLKAELALALEHGHINLKELCIRFSLQRSQASQMLLQILSQIEKTNAYQNYQKFAQRGRIYFADETWIHIQDETWYIIVILNEYNEVLDAFLERDRSGPTLLKRFKSLMNRGIEPMNTLVTDDFAGYQWMVLELGCDLIHIRHIHKAPYGRVIIDSIEWHQEKAHYTTLATTNDIFKESNLFLGNITKHIRKKHIPQKRGRKKGTRNRPKDVIEAEKRQKAETPPKKRGPTNYFRSGELHYYQYRQKERLVIPRWGSDPRVAMLLTDLGRVFDGKCITTNLVEKEWSGLKELINFRGKRSVEVWQKILPTYFVLRREKSAASEVMSLIPFKSQVIYKNINHLIQVQKPNYALTR